MSLFSASLQCLSELGFDFSCSGNTGGAFFFSLLPVKVLSIGVSLVYRVAFTYRLGERAFLNNMQSLAEDSPLA